MRRESRYDGLIIDPPKFGRGPKGELWKLEESGAGWVYQIARLNPFTHAVEWLRFALYDKDPGASPYVVLGTLLVCFALAAWGYDPQRGFGQLTKRGGGPG